jgi:hypothetical protein
LHQGTKRRRTVNNPRHWWPKYGFFVIAAVIVATLWVIGLATVHGSGSSVEQILHWFSAALGALSLFNAARNSLTLPRRLLVAASYLCLVLAMGALFIWTASPKGPSYFAWISEAAIFASLGLNWLQASRARRNAARVAS